MDKNGTIHERITQLVDTFGKGKNTVFASLIGSNEANVRGYKTSVMPKFDFLEKIVRSIDIDLRWLLTGEGSMLHESVQLPNEPVSASSDAVTMRLMDKLDDKEAENKHLQSELRSMEKELAVLKALHSQSQDKEPEHHSNVDKALELFSLEPSEASIKGYSPTSPPAISKKLSAGKI